MSTNGKDWRWFGHAGHLIVAQWCRFHLTTQVGDYLVSTVGEYWPERKVREIHAEVHDGAWLAENQALKGDTFDAAYMKRFGFETIGSDRIYETMVFGVGSKKCEDPKCRCGLPIPTDWGELDFAGYNDAGSATKGHLKLCRKWSKK